VYVGYAMFPQANVPSEPDPRSDQERMRRELALVDLAGELGFDELWVTEHHFGDYNLAPAPLQVLSYVCGRFPRMRVGSMVVVLPWNDPLRVVEQVIMLDYLSGGRCVIGFGKGEARREFAAFGIDLDEGRRRFDENLELVLRALESGVIARDGEPSISVRPQPAASFHRRLYMAAGSPASVDQAARRGLGLLRIALRSWEEVADQVERHREVFLDSHGVDPPPTVLLTYGYVDRDAGRARELGRRYAIAYRESAIAHYELGTDAERELERFADSQLWGTPDEFVEKAATVAEMTRTEHLVVVFRYAGVPYEEAETVMRLFAADVAPRVRAIQRLRR
jgi:alkanesulfonate monooxygenase SsuD/methylene tetrahydromethanopterin reductase-like flavin-dependent oxidoreductase (luciferase family)